jgi:hypothetical protein
MHIFSPAQCVGYVAFFLGVSAFLQKKDRSLKILLTGECLAYAIHFLLLGNLPASGSSAIACVRNIIALKTRSLYVAAVVIVANIATGIAFAKSGTAWFPLIGGCLGVIAIFLLNGIPMRLVLLTSTFLWLTNNILSRSIGGTMLEATIAVVNITTIVRLLCARSAKASESRVASCES